MNDGSQSLSYVLWYFRSHVNVRARLEGSPDLRTQFVRMSGILEASIRQFYLSRKPLHYVITLSK